MSYNVFKTSNKVPQGDITAFTARLSTLFTISADCMYCMLQCNKTAMHNSTGQSQKLIWKREMAKHLELYWSYISVSLSHCCSKALFTVHVSPFCSHEFLLCVCFHIVWLTGLYHGLNMYKFVVFLIYFYLQYDYRGGVESLFSIYDLVTVMWRR